jgi:phosphohistidine phosphatase
MKIVTLLRHAKSSWKDPQLSDIDRPLNKRGRRDVPLMGQRLARLDFKPELIISSPAVRAVSTAEGIAAAIAYDVAQIGIDAQIYESGSDELLTILHGQDDRCEHVMLTGHNPGLTELLELLAQPGISNIPTCGIATLAFQVDHWRDVIAGEGELLAYDFPKNNPPRQPVT